jgi:F-type H+-transporting ATPase subunit b
MAALGVNLGFFIVQLLNFLIVMIVLTAWAYRPVVNLLEKRKQKIAQGLEDARVASEARANAEKEAQKIIAAAQAEANRRVAEATERAEKAAGDVRSAAEEERQRILRTGQEDAAAERNRILADLRGQVGALAIAAANKVIGESLDEKRQQALIKDFFSGVKNGRVEVLTGSDGGVSDSAVEVTSALPLDNHEQDNIRKELGRTVGSASAVVFRVDPSILGGLVVRIGDKVLDGSVAGKLEGLRTSLK